jgi:hypothetical protein
MNIYWNKIRLLEYEQLQRMVDYSFGDHSGVLGRCPNAHMRKANINNLEFIEKVNNHNGKIMTLFIDNIRLYKRPLGYNDWEKTKKTTEEDIQWLNQFNDEDLLDLCSKFPKKQFCIFTAFEDVCLGEDIEDRIPNNVRSINATNSVYFSKKVIPMPHGLERIMHYGYNHHQILINQMNVDPEPSKLLYVNHREDTGQRGSLRDMLRSWATISERLTYQPYLKQIQEHTFVLCPSGNGIGSARNWETLYLKRVPVLEWHPYKEVVFSGLPVLFVNSYKDLTKELLENNNNLFEQAKNINMDKLNLDKIFQERINL